MRRLGTIANALLGDIGRKLSFQAREKYAPELDLYARAVNQKRADKNKIYSLHEPEVYCIAKGKERKKYEFGNKVDLAQTITTGIIIGAQNAYNEYDGHCLPGLLDQITAITGRRPERVFCDRGFRSKTRIGGTEIELPNRPKKNSSAHYKRKAQSKFRRRSAIEATNSHVKHDFRMLRNYLKGTIGDTINLLLAAAAYNFMKLMRATARHIFALIFIWMDRARLSLSPMAFPVKHAKSLF